MPDDEDGEEVHDGNRTDMKADDGKRSVDKDHIYAELLDNSRCHRPAT